MWYYTLNNQQVGPVEEEEIKKLVEAGTITHATLVWTAGMANWVPIAQSALAPLMGGVVPPVAAATVPPPIVITDPEVESINKLWMWFWISLIGILFFGIGLIPALVLFFILFWKAWKQTWHEDSRTNADNATAWLMIPGWGFYWSFPAFRGLAREYNALFDKFNIPMEKFNLDIPTWMLISLYAGFFLVFPLIAFIVLWIIYTKKIKEAYIAVHLAKK